MYEILYVIPRPQVQFTIYQTMAIISQVQTWQLAQPMLQVGLWQVMPILLHSILITIPCSLFYSSSQAVRIRMVGLAVGKRYLVMNQAAVTVAQEFGDTQVNDEFTGDMILQIPVAISVRPVGLILILIPCILLV